MITLSKKMSQSITWIMYAALCITFVYLYAFNPEKRGTIILCCLLFTAFQIIRYHFITNYTKILSLSILLCQIAITFFLQTLDGSFVPQIYFFILIAEITYRANPVFSIPFSCLCYLAFVIGVYIYLDFPPFSEVFFVLPRMVEYLLFFGFSYISRKLTEKSDEVKRINKRLQSAAVELEHKTLIEERVRLSREIHDTIGHTLTTALVGMETSKQLIKHNRMTDAIQKLTDSQEHVRKGLDDVRKAVKTLHERQSFIMFEPALKKLIEETRKQSGAQIVERIGSLPPLTATQEVAIYRALQEGLTNGLRHGKSTAFTFTLKGDAKQLMFELQDNGTMPERIQYGFGLTAMRERVSFLGGTMEIGRNDELGCRLRIILPLHPEQADASATGNGKDQTKIKGQPS